MRVFETYERVPAEALGSVVIIGNFDGVHAGHAALIARARQIAQRQGKKVSVLTFEPHPRSLFRPDDPPFRLTPPALKAKLLAERGVDFVFSVKFDWDFASRSAENFVLDVLLDGLKPAHVVVGYDFHFGQMRKGTPETLKVAGLEVAIVSEIKNGADVISSSAIREHLRQGNMAQANALLGWEWEVWGEVVKGDQRGRALGFPTANFALGQTLHPAYGVYASLVQIAGETDWRPAATNIGIRPMFEVKEAQVETYIFDFSREIYGHTLKVKPVRYLRGEAKFNSTAELIEQMKKDCVQAAEILKS
jgi:riboflavin kinase / FMN adenylyltransferase